MALNRAHHGVESPSQVEVQHVPVMQGTSGSFGPGDLQHGFVQVDPFHLEELAEEAQVFPGAAGDVQHTPQRPPRCVPPASPAGDRPRRRSP